MVHVSAVQLVQCRSGRCQLFSEYRLNGACVSCLEMQVKSDVYELSRWCKLNPVCISCPAGAWWIQRVSVVRQGQVKFSMYYLARVMQVRPGMYQLFA